MSNNKAALVYVFHLSTYAHLPIAKENEMAPFKNMRGERPSTGHTFPVHEIEISPPGNMGAENNSC